MIHASINDANRLKWKSATFCIGDRPPSFIRSMLRSDWTNHTLLHHVSLLTIHQWSVRTRNELISLSDVTSSYCLHQSLTTGCNYTMEQSTSTACTVCVKLVHCLDTFYRTCLSNKVTLCSYSQVQSRLNSVYSLISSYPLPYIIDQIPPTYANRLRSYDLLIQTSDSSVTSSSQNQGLNKIIKNKKMLGR
jgi:hypothetical protein